VAAAERILLAKDAAIEGGFHDIPGRRADPTLEQCLAHGRRSAGNDRCIDADGVFPPGAAGVRRDVRDGNSGNIRDARRETRGKRVALGDDVIQLGELRQGNGALQFAHAVVQGDEFVIGIGLTVRPCFVDEERDSAREGRVIGHDDTALARRDVLALLQAKAADGTDRAGVTSVVLREQRLRGVFDHRNTQPIRELDDRIHLGRNTEEVRDDDGFGLR